VSGFVRQAGAGILADGSRLVWSVADGLRGRRWRAVASRHGVISHALLLEVDVEGRPSRLELTTAAGMLTLHPDEARRSLHGNVVTADGVRHLRLPWSEQHGLEVEGRPIAGVVTAHRLAGSMVVGEGRTIPVVVLTADLTVSEATRRFVRLGDSGWRIEGESGAAGATTLKVDARGIPVDLLDGRDWALEPD
jgi:CBS domain-containing protein